VPKIKGDVLLFKFVVLMTTLTCLNTENFYVVAILKPLNIYHYFNPEYLLFGIGGFE